MHTESNRYPDTHLKEMLNNPTNTSDPLGELSERQCIAILDFTSETSQIEIEVIQKSSLMV